MKEPGQMLSNKPQINVLNRLLCAALALLVSFTATWAQEGGYSGGGGDGYALEFVGLARLLGQAMQSGRLRVPGVDPSAYSAGIEKIKVETKDQTRLRGAEVDAINYAAEMRIELSRARWRQYQNDLSRKLSLVLHETLGVLQQKDRHYEFSADVFDQLQKDPAALGLNGDQLFSLVILSALEMHCGDTWCEGDYGFRFQTVECKAESETCEIYLSVIDEDQVQVEQRTGVFRSVRHSRSTTYEATCMIPHVANPSELVTLDKYGVSLSTPFLESMSDCIEGLENAL